MFNDCEKVRKTWDLNFYATLELRKMRLKIKRYFNSTRGISSS